MPWLHKKLLLKFFLWELILGLAGFATWSVKPDYAAFTILAVAVLSMVGFIVWVTHPLSKIMREFKALLTGKQYRRIYTKKIDEIGIMAHFFNQVTHSLERVSSNIKEHKRLSTELNVARKIQQDLIPKEAPPIPGLDITAKTKPAAEIGGDAFDFLVKENQTFMYIGDVTGHGVPSGLVMMIADTLIHTFADTSQTGHELLVKTNKYLKPRIQTTMFMTMLMLRWKHSTQEMFYTGAGHETLLHFKAADRTCDNIKAGGIALGMVPDNEKLIKEQSISLNEGDFLVLYSDGIVEAKNQNGEMYSIDMFKSLVEREARSAESAADLFQKLSSEVLKFLGDFIQLDDMTLMVIKKGPSAQKTDTPSAPTAWGNDTVGSNPVIPGTALGEDTETKVEESGLSTI